MGQQLLLQHAYLYELPEVPTKDKILFSNLPVKEQYWRRVGLTAEEINKLPIQEQRTIADIENERRLNGVWFYNNGEPTYLTGHNYFYLQWYKIRDVGYPDFRKFQTDFFYFYDYCEKDPNCEGVAISKIRRAGVTGMFVAINLNLLTLNFEKTIGVQSKVKKDAISNNYKPYKYALKNLPKILKPLTRKNDTESVEFGSPNIKITNTRQNIKAISDMEGRLTLECEYFWQPTVEDTFDGNKYFKIDCDEVSKYKPSESIKQSLFINRPCVKIGTKQIGKLAYYSTSALRDTRNFLEWKTIYFDSDFNKRKFKKTTSGLYKWFISALVALEGDVNEELGIDLTDIKFFDVYGNCDEQLAYKTVMEIIRKPLVDKGDWVGLQVVKRQYPIDEDDAFNSGGSSNVYDNAHLVEAYANIEIREGRGEILYVEGNTDWDDPQHTRVKFVKMPFGTGKGKMYVQPREPNRVFIDKYGNLSPYPDTDHITTVDPYDYLNQTEDRKGSQCAIVTGSLASADIQNGGNIINKTYLNRPPTVEDMLDDLKKELIYFGSLCYIEKNVAWLVQRLINDGFGRFLLVWDKKGEFRRWRYGDTTAGGFTSDILIDAYIRATESYIRRPSTKDGIDYCMLLLDKETNRQLRDFDRNDTEKFDAAVAFSFWCMVTKQYHRIMEAENRESSIAITKAFYGIRENAPKKFGKVTS